MSIVKGDRSSRRGTPEGVQNQKEDRYKQRSYLAKSPKSHYSKDFEARGLLPAKPLPDLTAGPVPERHSDYGRHTSLSAKANSNC